MNINQFFQNLEKNLTINIKIQHFNSIHRFLGGMGLGFELAVATVYIVEIASTDMRGVLGCFVQFMGSIGVLFTFVAGTFLNWYLFIYFSNFLKN